MQKYNRTACGILKAVASVKNNKSFHTILNVASSVLWGGLGGYMTLAFALGILSSLRSKRFEFIGSYIVLLLGGIVLLLAAILIWSRRRRVKWIVCVFSCLCSILMLFALVGAAAAGHWQSLDFYLALLIPFAGILLSIFSLICLPPKKSNQEESTKP
ncbi:MAG: hypothetical protein II851_05720 [Bacteroidales bacterium]|nr:hypothetical protein [Bacteroidales bacterium]